LRSNWSMKSPVSFGRISLSSPISWAVLKLMSHLRAAQKAAAPLLREFSASASLIRSNSIPLPPNEVIFDSHLI